MGYWDTVKKIIEEADVVVEVADARFPEQSRNLEIEKLVESYGGKKLLIVLNKADLVSKRQAQYAKEGLGKRGLFVSAKERQGVAMLKAEISILSGEKEAKVAVVGYPNTGKSSVINMLSGRKAARTSSTAGFTRGKQFVKISANIMLIDSPGIIPMRENDEALMAMLSVKSSYQLKDLEGAGISIAEMLLKNNPEGLAHVYGVRAESGDEFLEKFALKRKKLLKGGKPDTNAAARILIDDFQQGRIGKNGWAKRIKEKEEWQNEA